MEYYGATHYTSALIDENTCIAGVKGKVQLAILTSVHGQLGLVDNPSVSGGTAANSGKTRDGREYYTRTIYNSHIRNNFKPLLFSIKVTSPTTV